MQRTPAADRSRPRPELVVAARTLPPLSVTHRGSAVGCRALVHDGGRAVGLLGGRLRTSATIIAFATNVPPHGFARAAKTCSKSFSRRLRSISYAALCCTTSKGKSFSRLASV